MSTAATYEIYYCEAAAGTEWESESRAESHAEKKISWPFQILREVKKSAKTQNQRKKNEKEKRTEMHTHTNAELHILLGLRPMLWKVPRLRCQLQGRMEDEEWTGGGGVGG